MICFPNAKINLGLNIINKRTDGYHNIETVFYPVDLKDALELIIDEGTTNIELSQTGIIIPGDSKDNLCVKAYHLVKKDYKIPGIKAHLHKVIPTGAGLGGGSSDAAFFITTLNKLCGLNLSIQQMQNYASVLGSDCAFFIENKTVFAEGRGNEFTPVAAPDLMGYWLVMVKPDIHVSTADAYAGVHPKPGKKRLSELIQLPVHLWKETIHNDFEDSVFKKFPELAQIKSNLYKEGAVYAAMSGSGATVFGIFESKPVLKLTVEQLTVLQLD